MNLSEAKDFYMTYNGQSFHMGREETDKYQKFKDLNVPEDVISEWDKELLENHFANLWLDEEKVWIVHSRIIEVLQRNKVNVTYFSNLLLDEMEKMDKLDELNRILIIENMAGRGNRYQDGMCYVVCQHTDLKEKMNAVMNKIIAVKAKNTPDRFNKAVNNYHKAYSTYKIK